MVSGINSFSTASLSEMRQKMFNKIDTNSDGSIDKTEMSALLQQNTSQDTSSLVDKIFSTQDTDQNGLISLIESSSAMEKLGQEMKKSGGKCNTGSPLVKEKSGWNCRCQGLRHSKHAPLSITNQREPFAPLCPTDHNCFPVIPPSPVFNRESRLAGHCCCRDRRRETMQIRQELHRVRSCVGKRAGPRQPHFLLKNF